MAGKELRANIVLGGRTDPSLAHVGAQLEMLGNKVNQISSRLIDFGKESVQTTSIMKTRCWTRRSRYRPSTPPQASWAR
ncbi:MAG: hypothetical protein ACLUI3_00245 [Christensenellales bacterium]